MKKNIITIFSVLSGLLLQGCGGSCGNEPDFQGNYFFENASGYTLTIVHRPSCVELPDYLTLQPGEIYRIDESEMILSGMKSFFDTDRYNIFDIREIRYDNSYAIPFEELPRARKPQYRTNYDINADLHYIFTFKPEDYQYAVDHGAVIEENE